MLFDKIKKHLPAPTKFSPYKREKSEQLEDQPQLHIEEYCSV